MSDIQSISITSTQTVAQPKPHTTYTIQISTPIRTWTVDRRYNDFLSLNAELKSSTGKEPPAGLPGKHSWSITRSVYDDKVIRERRVLLEQYLRSILTSKDSRWRQSFGFSDFLAVPSPRAGPSSSSAHHPMSHSSASGIAPPPEHFTPSTWLSEHTSLLSLVRLIRSSLLKRDALALQMSDAGGARSASVEAKRLLKELQGRLGELEKGLEGLLGVGEGEKIRREEMVESLKGELGNLTRMAEAGVRTNLSGGSASFPPSKSGGTPQQQHGTMPGGTGSLWGPAPQTGRVFGRSSTPQETEQTRPLDDRGLVQLQQTQMDNQDEQLQGLSKVLQRQRKMGEEIAQEIGEQNELLDHVEGEVTRVGGKLGRAKRELNKLNS